MKMKLGLAALICLAAPTIATATLFDPGLGGTKSTDSWTDLTSTTLPFGYSSLGGGRGAWPGPITSQNGSGDATFVKTAGAYYSYAAGIYSYGTTGPNDLTAPWNGATAAFRFADSTPVAGVKNLVVQVPKIFDANSGSQVFPAITLSYNSGSQAVTPTRNVSSDPEHMLYQWDLSSLGAINNFTIDWSGVYNHNPMNAFRIDQSSVYTAAVPEPASIALVGMVGAGLLARRRKR